MLTLSMYKPMQMNMRLGIATAMTFSQCFGRYWTGLINYSYTHFCRIHVMDTCLFSHTNNANICM